MILPIPRRLSSTQIILGLLAGTITTIYVWTPIIKEQNRKERLKGQTTDLQPQSVDTQAQK